MYHQIIILLFLVSLGSVSSGPISSTPLTEEDLRSKFTEFNQRLVVHFKQACSKEEMDETEEEESTSPTSVTITETITTMEAITTMATTTTTETPSSASPATNVPGPVSSTTLTEENLRSILAEFNQKLMVHFKQACSKEEESTRPRSTATTEINTSAPPATSVPVCQLYSKWNNVEFCKNNGMCYAESDDPFEPKCKCPPNFTGNQCETEIAEVCQLYSKWNNVEFCKNSGMCYAESDDLFEPKCKCPPNFTGNRCETEIQASTSTTTSATTTTSARTTSAPQTTTAPEMKYVVITGDDNKEAHQKAHQMEVINEFGQTKVCKKKFDYPLQGSRYGFRQATAVSSNGHIIICGGRKPRTADCNVFRGDGQGWSNLVSMDKPKSSSASIPIEGGILVSGGYDGSNYLKTNQMVFLNGSVQPGLPLPEARFEHCMLEYNGQIISTGGWNGDDYVSTVWIFDNKQQFTLVNQSQMNYKRAYHGCGIFHSDHHAGRPIIVVSGAWSGGGEWTSEFLDFTRPGAQWQLCTPDLPVRMWEGPRITPTVNKKGLIMTYKKGVYQFKCTSSEDCYWVKEQYELKISRRNHIFLTVPSYLVDDC